MHGYSAWAKNGTGARKENGGWGLEEEERLAGSRAREFLDVVAIVQCHSVKYRGSRLRILRIVAANAHDLGMY